MFDLMMRAFGDRVRAVRGVWRPGYQGRSSTNLDRVNELTGRGVPLAEAVAKTWTATRAARWGFQRVRVVEEPTGVAGAFTKVDVLFEK
jgi:hypothetical protein